jgi:hypothetical protein
LLPESLGWTAAQAQKQLSDPRRGVSAAIRLLRLADIDALCAPPELGDTQFRQLALRPLAEECWALGLREARQPDVLRAPVLFEAGSPRIPFPDEQELLRLYVSDDAEVFPHLATLPDRVFLLTSDEITPALALKPDQPVMFQFCTDRGYRYVGLMLLTDRREVARFTWDPYESAFMGPAADQLPDPPGGTFALRLTESQRLIPVGGELPDPAENADPPQRHPPPSRWLPA